MDLCDHIQAGINRLATIRTTVALSNGFAQDLKPLKDAVEERLAERAALLEDVKKLIDAKNTILDQLKALSSENATSKKGDVLGRLKQLKETEENISLKVTRLEINERLLFPKLKELEGKVTLATNVAGVPVQPMERAAEKPGSQGSQHN